MERTLADARGRGASIIVAKGTLTGHTGPEGLPYAEMQLTDVHTLSGPSMASGSHVWANSAHGPSGPIPGADAGALWATDGSLFAIIWPQPSGGFLTGPTMSVAPVVGNQVILSTAGCWNTTGLTSTPFTGPLAEIPGSDSYTRAAVNGLHGVPLDTIQALATH
ncbi:hypothetical protein C7C46_00670 [Streptomyces tateyamensis]|uniref:Uncharacterized protein n=2 Tax=Streptomyces tateyamensis TaxID=565073 RepID=A0A2V4P3X9_9ACTN|nr:hypothetical protein C7C46_00670 [Streptomyces tateyamensis]